MKISFAEINLSELDLLRLKIADKSDSVMFNSGEEQILAELGFIERCPHFDTPYHYSITSDGRLYLNYLKQKEKSDEQERDRWFRENKREWIGIGLSAVIAFMSFIISLMSLRQ